MTIRGRTSWKTIGLVWIGLLVVGGAITGIAYIGVDLIMSWVMRIQAAGVGFQGYALPRGDGDAMRTLKLPYALLFVSLGCTVWLIRVYLAGRNGPIPFWCS